jgi:iron complex outermembrane receptor protein
MKISVLLSILFALSFLSWNVKAQAQAESALPTVEVTADQVNFIEATRFPLFPLSQTPISAQTVDEEAKQEAHVQRLSDVTRIDASASDSYNANGYWDFLNVRGYTLDNRFSYLREGLPINAETSLPLDNKKSIEILKGLSGMPTTIGIFSESSFCGP